ncbi:hypothetical protein N7497_010794 [Penicillium chrysogenum]|nr:hypothetical protein N7497_010794 [Penicillium chrysogenum]
MEFAPHDPDIFLREFRRIGPNIYDVPYDFIMKLDAKKCSLYEPVDDELWNLCAGRISTTTHFTLDRIYYNDNLIIQFWLSGLRCNESYETVDPTMKLQERSNELSCTNRKYCIKSPTARQP